MTTHPEVIIPPECGFIIWLRKKYGDWCVTDNSETPRLELFCDDLFECKKFDTWRLNREGVKKQVLIHQPVNYAELCRVVYASFAVDSGREFSIWGDKNNFYLSHLDELLDLYKGAKFLHIVRDGRDIACSYREVMKNKSDSPYAPNLKTGIYDIAMEWSSNAMKIDSFMSEQETGVAITVRYEDLVLEPLVTIKSICKWLGIPFEVSMLDYYQKNKKNNLEPSLTIDWKKRTLKPISDETVGRFVKLLSIEEQAEFVKIAEEALKRFLYLRRGIPN